MTAPTTGTALDTGELRAMLAEREQLWDQWRRLSEQRQSLADTARKLDMNSTAIAGAMETVAPALLDAANERDDLLSKVERLEAVIAGLAEKAPEQRLLEAIFGTTGCRCGCGSPRWDQDRIVLEHGWNTPDRCGRCGEPQPEGRAALATDTTTEAPR